MVWINYVKLDPRAQICVYQTEGSAAADLHALEDCLVRPGKSLLVKTGLALQIPEGYVGMVCPRSGLALKYGISVANAPGLIDSDFRGEVCVILTTSSTEMIEIKAGDRVAQLMIVPVMQAIFKEVKELTTTERGQNGFGSTGKN